MKSVARLLIVVTVAVDRRLVGQFLQLSYLLWCSRLPDETTVS